MSNLTRGRFYRLASLKLRTYSTKSVEQKYQEKLFAKAKAHGFQSIAQLKEHLKEDIATKKKEFDRIDPLKELERYEARMNTSANHTKMSKPLKTAKPTGKPIKTLDTYLAVDKIKDLSKQEIEFLWRARWASKENALNSVVPSDVFSRILVNAKANPIFVLPLPRKDPSSKDEEGMELHYIQWKFMSENTTHCIMTTLAEYKLHNEFAKPHTVLEFHTELAKDKKIVFMNGQVESDGNVSLSDAQLLLLNIQRFYGAMGDKTPAAQQRLKLLNDFTKGSTEFQVNDLIRLAQSLEN